MGVRGGCDVHAVSYCNGPGTWASTFSRPLRNSRHTGESRYPETMHKGQQICDLAIHPHPNLPPEGEGTLARPA